MKKSIITMLLLTTAAAFANEAADAQTNRTSFAGERTRAEVKAEVQRARQEGALFQAEYTAHEQKTPQGASRSRAELRTEAVQAARVRVIQEQI